MPHTITFSKLKDLVEDYTGVKVNTCMFWGTYPITVHYQENRKAYHRKLRWIAKKSTKLRPNVRDIGHRITVDDVKKIVWHFNTVGVLPLGRYEVIP